MKCFIHDSKYAIPCRTSSTPAQSHALATNRSHAYSLTLTTRAIRNLHWNLEAPYTRKESGKNRTEPLRSLPDFPDNIIET